ncbi:hypothetical protein MGYG_05122 [Nannizzia gypsea CBS 118893]|uniref:Uncharacterized protein n=1 Tax=Arthroderma gypseum (strain ATCC MYA-4604 / CBS 118893) TaxID=535722 RepID=E4UYF7_ARTGP|nr:hypothetical protein MGYG_05122 [Nannizzia gypsea CBS 118893]EFR02120.1 hypothetical protein MGYG_05122 [Nannizzia gypsea CBS 118893]
MAGGQFAPPPCAPIGVTSLPGRKKVSSPSEIIVIERTLRPLVKLTFDYKPNKLYWLAENVIVSKRLSRNDAPTTSD